MKIKILLLCLISACFTSCVSPYYNSDSSQHARYIENSRNDWTTIISMDTIYRRGIAYALYRSSEYGAGGYSEKVTALRGNDCVDIYYPQSSYIRYEFRRNNSIDIACIEGQSMNPYYQIRALVDADLFTPTGWNTEKVKAYCVQNSCDNPTFNRPPVKPIPTELTGKSNEIYCMSFEDKTLQGCEAMSVSTDFNVGGPKGYDDIYLRCGDQPGVSYIKLPQVFLGDWTAQDNCTRTICFDAQIFNDGDESKHNAYSIGLRVTGGGYTASFTDVNVQMTEQDGKYRGWHHVCATISSKNIPPGWVMTGGANPSAWPALMKNVTGVTIGYDTSTGQNEVFGLDNICIKTDCIELKSR